MTQRPILKACACLVDARGRLLVFHHPEDRDMQLPKGTIEPGEAPEDAVRRELLEESGIRHTGELVSLGTMDRNYQHRSQLWYLFLMRAQAVLPETFEHVAMGSPEEDGLVFSFRWLTADAPLDGFAAPYVKVIAKVRETLKGQG
jgi:8-oxo-dGTP pyrophosphatase MutT (NUDIX family)